MVLCITAREWRHVTLSCAQSTRPSSVRCRQALFDILQHTPFFENWRQAMGRGRLCVDLFAGSGVVGFEYLQRWPESDLIFLEKDPEALKALRENIQRLDVASSCRVAFADLSKKMPILPEGIMFCFVDPPYHFPLRQDFFERWVGQKILAKEALIVIQTSPKTSAHTFNGLEGVSQHRCGNALLSFFRLRV